MMLGRARVGIRYARAFTALTKLILLALVGLVAALRLDASAAYAQIAGGDRLIGVGAGARRPRIDRLSLTAATRRPRNDLAARPDLLTQLIDRCVAFGNVAVVRPFRRLDANAGGGAQTLPFSGSRTRALGTGPGD